MAKTITIPVETLRQLLDYNPETGDLLWRPRPEQMFAKKTFQRIWNTRYAGKKAFTTITPGGYLKAGILGKKYLFHRVLWAYINGEWPDKIDHIDGNTKNNAVNNLRNVSDAGNSHNLKKFKTNTSGVTGVSRWKGHKKFRADITVGRKQIYLGTFDTVDEAIDARKTAEIKSGFHPNHGR